MKRDINIDRKTLASDEINATKDFSSVVSKVEGASSVSPKSPKGNTGWIMGGIAAVAIALGIYFGTTETTPLENKTAYTPTLAIDSTETAFVNPPAPSAILPSESYFVNADKGGAIKHHTGTDITIPAGAFMDEEGNVITGEVEVQYREFHDQADIFLSGIPMDYDTLNEKHIFESAGMLEIRGFQNGKRLKITPNKNFRICMHTKNPDPKFNVYYLNEEDKKWDYEGKDSISVPGDKSTVEPLNQNEFGNSGLEFEIVKEELKKEITQSSEELVVIKKEIKTIKKTEPSKPIKANKDKKNFTIDVVKTEYPELAVYTGTIFEVKRNEDLPEDTYNVTWNGVKLTEENKLYSIELTKGERTEKIAVTPVLEGKNYEEAKIIFDSKFDEYNTQLNQKLKEEKLAEDKLNELKERFKKEREEFDRQQQILRDQLNVQQASRITMQRVFKINRFGAWNSDSPIKYPKGMITQASYVDATGAPLNFTSLNLIEKKRNACFPLNGKTIHRLPFNPKNENILWGVTSEGDIAVAKSTEFKNVQDSHIFKMILIDVKGKSNEEIKALITS